MEVGEVLLKEDIWSILKLIYEKYGLIFSILCILGSIFLFVLYYWFFHLKNLNQVKQDCETKWRSKVDEVSKENKKLYEELTEIKLKLNKCEILLETKTMISGLDNLRTYNKRR